MQRNILIVIVALLAVHTATAQVRFGLKAGFTGASMDLSNTIGTVDNRKFMLPAFHAGVLTDIPLGKNLAVQPALLYSVKGYRTRPEAEAGNWYYIAKYRYNYLELPVNILYKGRIGQGKLFAGAGPSLAYGIGGKVTYIKQGTTENTKRIKFDGDGTIDPAATAIHANRIDVAANFLVGYEFSNGMLLSGSYSPGFLDVDPSENTKALNRSFSISFGYLFPRK